MQTTFDTHGAHLEFAAAKEFDLGIEIVHGLFKERGNSILHVFYCELLRV